MAAPGWREQIGNIIAETERNLGGRPSRQQISRAAPVLPCTSYSVNNAPSSAPSSPPPGGAGGAQYEETAFGPSFQRVLEQVKFELDVRGSLAQKQLEAVREELSAGLADAERKCLDIAQEMEVSLKKRLDTEVGGREARDATVLRLQATLDASREETMRLLSEFQGTALDHSEVLRRLEAELGAFRLDAESRIADESWKLAKLVAQQKDLTEGIELSGAEATLARLKACEEALLKERELRLALDDDVAELRQATRVGGGGALDAAIARALEEGGAVGAIDEKVKECGRLIVRMGTELMDEARRRQALETEVQELKMRLAGVEVISRQPGGDPLLGGALPAAFAPGRVSPPLDAVGGGLGASFAEVASGVPPPVPAFGGAAGASAAEPWSASRSSAVDHRLSQIVAGQPSAGGSLSASASYAQLLSQGGGAGGGGGSASDSGGAPGSSAALRLSRQQLDERVQQILSRHCGDTPRDQPAAKKPPPPPATQVQYKKQREDGRWVYGTIHTMGLPERRSLATSRSSLRGGRRSHSCIGWRWHHNGWLRRRGHPNCRRDVGRARQRRRRHGACSEICQCGLQDVSRHVRTVQRAQPRRGGLLAPAGRGDRRHSGEGAL